MPRTIPALHDADWLRTRYHDEGRTADEIAAMLGCGQVAVLKAMRRHAIPRRTPQESMRLRGTLGRRRFAPLGDAAWLRRRYVDEDASTLVIARELGCTPRAVNMALREHGIAIQSASDRSHARSAARRQASKRAHTQPS